MKTLIGIVSYGGLPFLEIGLRAIRDTMSVKADVIVIAAKPGDVAMEQFLFERGFAYMAHQWNKGFPASVNDLYDAAFTWSEYDALICMGNDVVPMPGALDSMINFAASSEYDMVCGSEFNAKFLVDNYPEARQYFHGDNLVFSDYSGRPWELHRDFRTGVEPGALKDVRNMTLFKRSSFQKVGYDDVNFWPNGYYADNDYCVRCNRAGVTAAGLQEAAFFHFASRTIHQGEPRDHGVYSVRNHAFYREKYGGDPGHETYELPFHGDPYELAPGLILPGTLKIEDRSMEQRIIDFWRSR